MPALARVHHQRRDDGMIGPALFDFGNFAEVGFGRTVADEFDVVEADHARGAEIQSGVARRDVDDRVTDSLPDDAAPTCLERAMALVGGIGGWAGAYPERVGGFDAGEVDG